MKKVISNKELYTSMQEAISLLCVPVKSTLGPKGNNVIIDHSTFNPFITNDGVTIASNIESDDVVINTILEIAKEASIKTNDIVGDGTSTTLVLLESIFTEGLKLIQNGVNPITLKKEIDNSLNNIIELLKKESKLPKKNDLIKIAAISANDKYIGNLIGTVYNKIGSKNAISIIESDDNKTTVKYLKGYSFDTNIVSDYYFQNSNIIKLSNCYLLLINNLLENINDIAHIINFINEKNNNLVIMANDYSDLFINEILNLYLNENIKIYLLKTPEYGNRGLSILKDLDVIIDDKLVSNLNYISLNNLGLLKKIEIKRDTTIIDYEINENIKNRIKEIEKELINSTLDNDFINKRISMFNNGLATISVGAITSTERRELKMRYDDALWATDSATAGILPGGGIIYLKISDNLNIETNADKILKTALTKPFLQILENAGINNNKNILDEIRKSNYKVLFNTLTNEYENINATTVLDSTNVVINALKNACSISSMLLTTKHLIINEYQNNLNKINDYNEL